MAGRLNRGEMWLLRRRRPDKKRPVLVLTRPSLIRLLHTATVAAVAATSNRPLPYTPAGSERSREPAP